MDAVNGHNGRGKATSVSYFDFSTLYTKILHAKLLKVLNELIDFCFRGGDGEFISGHSHGDICAKNRSSGFALFTTRILKKTVIFYKVATLK